MSQSITLQLPDDLDSIAQAEAKRSSKPIEVVLVQWMQHGVGEDLQQLSNGELLAICASTM